MARGRLTAWLLGVGVTGVAAGIAVVAADVDALWLHHRAAVVLPLALVLILGELFPIALSREGDEVDEVSISSTVGLALVLVAPLAVVLIAQALGLLIDEGRRWHSGRAMRGPRLQRTAFNLGQYSLAFLAARWVYGAVAHVPLLTDQVAFAERMLPAAWLAGLTFYVVNSGLTSTAFALATRTTLGHQIKQDLRWQLASSAMLLGLAPIYAQSVLWSPWLLPFLLFPLVIVHRGATLAARRGSEALHDALTGLPNRVMLAVQLGRRLATPAAAHSGLLLIDLDHFKDVNDTLGHDVGDRLIRAVGQRLAALLGQDAFLCRLGGDEFAVVLSCDSAAELRAEATVLAEAICRLVQSPTAVEEITLHVGCSVGIALAPDHGTTVETLLQHADVALYAAKETRGDHACYDPARDTHTVQRLTLAEDLRHALARDELEVAFQPQVHARTRVVVGMEALARWTHPVIGTVDPERVINLAASTGLLSRVTDCVLDRGLQALREWDSLGHVLRLSVNLTARQLTDTELPTRIAEALRTHELSPDRLILEVTESTVMSDVARSGRVIRALKMLGVELSIDDFGTGYSSLAHLQRVGPHELKIDRSFVMSMVTSEADRTIVRSTLELGHNLGLRVVAEGVEDEETAALLAAWGCDVLQGYLLSVPRDAVAVTSWLERWHSPAVPAGLDLPGVPELH